MSNEKHFHSRQAKKRPKRRLRKHIKVLLAIFIMTFLAVGAYGINLYIKASTAINNAYEEDERDKSNLRDDNVNPKFDNVTVLIMGLDQNERRIERFGSTSRTDALILATLNREEKSIKLISIPRDAYVYIPEVGYHDKINHAHVFGGTKGTIETVENLLEIPVDYYVKLNFHAFVDVIDAIGGIEINVPYEVTESNSQDKRDGIHLYPGLQTLNGEEALAFARTRKKDSDIERGKRQLEVINAVIDKSTSVGSIFKYDDIIKAIGENMSTNMSFSEIKSFISYATNGNNLDVEKLSIQGEDYQPGSTYFYKLNDSSLEETKNLLKKHLELPTYVDDDKNIDETYNAKSESSY